MRSSKNIETTKSLKKSVNYLALIVLILRSYVDEPNRSINSEWAVPSHAVLERAVGEWCACVERGHFEHMLQ